VSQNLDLNTATEKELTGIRGVGKDYGKKIVDYRNQNGPFGSWDDLKLIPGTPGIIFEILRHHGCTVGGKAA